MPAGQSRTDPREVLLRRRAVVGEPLAEVLVRLLESADRAAGYFTTRSEAPASANARTAGVYWRANSEDCAAIMDGNDERRRAELIAEQLRRWKSITM